MSPAEKVDTASPPFMIMHRDTCEPGLPRGLSFETEVAHSYRLTHQTMLRLVLSSRMIDLAAHAFFLVFACLGGGSSQKGNRLQQQDCPPGLFLCFGRVALLWSCLHVTGLAQGKWDLLEGQAGLLFLATGAPPDPVSALHTAGSHCPLKQLAGSGGMMDRLPIHPEELGITCSVVMNVGHNLFFLTGKIDLNVYFNGFSNNANYSERSDFHA